MSRALFIGAHPDDVELGCGGLIDKLVKEGSDVRVISVAEDTSCRGGSKSEIVREIGFRTNCSIKSLESLGVHSYSFYNLPCGSLNSVPLLTINKIIEQEIQEFKPECVYTHSINDANIDHKIVYESTRIATRPGASSPVREVYSYEVLSSTEWNFNDTFKPNVFVGLSADNLSKKIKAFKFYSSEQKKFPYPRSDKGITTLANYRGMQIGEQYAEAFQLVRSKR